MQRMVPKHNRVTDKLTKLLLHITVQSSRNVKSIETAFYAFAGLRTS